MQIPVHYLLVKSGPTCTCKKSRFHCTQWKSGKMIEVSISTGLISAQSFPPLNLVALTWNGKKIWWHCPSSGRDCLITSELQSYTKAPSNKSTFTQP